MRISEIRTVGTQVSTINPMEVSSDFNEVVTARRLVDRKFTDKATGEEVVKWILAFSDGRGIWMNTGRLWDSIQDAAEDDLAKVDGLSFRLTVRQWVNANPEPGQLEKGQTFVLTAAPKASVEADLPF